MAIILHVGQLRSRVRLTLAERQSRPLDLARFLAGALNT